MKLTATSTADIDLRELAAFRDDLSTDFEVEVDESQVFLRSAEPPSWIQFLADSPWWVQAFGGYSALYLAELVKEAAKTTWAERAAVARKTKVATQALGRFARRLAKLRALLPERSQLVIGLPVPDHHFGVRFELLGREEDVLAAEIAIFASFVPRLEELIRSEQLDKGRVVGTVNLMVTEELQLKVAWMDRESLSIQERLLRHLQ
jgi:hypothetical protein